MHWSSDCSVMFCMFKLHSVNKHIDKIAMENVYSYFMSIMHWRRNVTTFSMFLFPLLIVSCMIPILSFINIDKFSIKQVMSIIFPIGKSSQRERYIYIYIYYCDIFFLYIFFRIDFTSLTRVWLPQMPHDVCKKWLDCNLVILWY